MTDKQESHVVLSLLLFCMINLLIVYDRKFSRAWKMEFFRHDELLFRIMVDRDTITVFNNNENRIATIGLEEKGM